MHGSLTLEVLAIVVAVEELVVEALHVLVDAVGILGRDPSIVGVVAQLAVVLVDSVAALLIYLL